MEIYSLPRWSILNKKLRACSHRDNLTRGHFLDKMRNQMWDEWQLTLANSNTYI